ncbi:MAG: hypothetical protein OEX02_08390 [Cyclobacteriaceae bacterium]|nr:hypothetical protein [Cyclobacteriaceae bacterium]
MSTSLKKDRAGNYFRFMKNWDNKSKKQLISKLTRSIDEKPGDDHNDFSNCFGAWQDDRSTEKIINEIRGSRINYREIEEF